VCVCMFLFAVCVFQEQQKRKFLSLYTLHLEVYKETRFYPVHSPDSLTFSFSLSCFIFKIVEFFNMNVMMPTVDPPPSEKLT
jgi:hypothetical protein